MWMPLGPIPSRLAIELLHPVRSSVDGSIVAMEIRGGWSRAGPTHRVTEGDVVFVERAVDHACFDLEEELVTLVFSAPPYGSLAGD